MLALMVVGIKKILIWGCKRRGATDFQVRRENIITLKNSLWLCSDLHYTVVNTFFHVNGSSLNVNSAAQLSYTILVLAKA